MTSYQINEQHGLRAHFLGRFIGCAEYFRDSFRADMHSADYIRKAMADVAEDYAMAYDYLESHGEHVSASQAIEYADQARKDANNGK